MGKAEDLQEDSMLLQAAESEESTPPQEDNNSKGWKWWLLVSLNITFLLIVQVALLPLSKLYFDGGGKSNWMASLIQTAAFPILFLPPIVFFPSTKPKEPDNTDPKPRTIALVYTSLGILAAVDNLLYSVGLLYLPMSTYSLLCASQLVFNAVLSKFINTQKFTVLIHSSVVLLSLSASLIAINSDSTESKKESHLIGFVTTIMASAGYALLLSLMEVSFKRVIKKETFSAVLDMQIYTSLVSTVVCLLGLVGSGEMWTLKEEIEGFREGKAVYVLSLVGSAVAWQVSSVGVVSLIFLVSSLFANVITMLTLPLLPVAGFVLYGDDMGWVKILATFLALLGCSCYFYQQYLDDHQDPRAGEANP